MTGHIPPVRPKAQGYSNLNARILLVFCHHSPLLQKSIYQLFKSTFRLTFLMKREMSNRLNCHRASKRMVT